MILDPLSLALGLLAGAAISGALAFFFIARSRDAFRAVSADALNANAETFLTMAAQRFDLLQESAKGDLEKRELAIQNTVAPVAKTLEALTEKLNEVEKARAGVHGELKQHLSALAETQMLLKGETGRLVQAMRTPMGRGSWGETQLERMLELVGMVEGVDYHRQMTVAGEDHSYRPDIVVKLPGDKSIVVDAKAPLEAYFAAIEAADETERQARLKDHARQVREQMKKLADKEYWKQFAHSPEFVVMFLPSEGACATALQSDPGMIEAGMRANVVIATPLTLFALLRTIAYGWRQERLADNASRIAALGRELFEAVARMADNYQKLGKSLGSSVESYNRALGQLEKSVLKPARRLREEHDVISTAEIPAPAELEATFRRYSQPEMIAALEEK